MKNWKTRFPNADIKATWTFRPGVLINEYTIQAQPEPGRTIIYWEQISPRKVVVLMSIDKKATHARQSN